MHPFLVAVHAGAGFHSPSREEAYKQVMMKACKAAATVIEAGGEALSAVEAAICVLEDSPLTNAACGSNLTAAGTVECDASIMDGAATFGAVGASPGLHNPIAAAALLARESREPLSHGRVRPLMLAGDGATAWAASKGLQATTSAAEAAHMHVTEKSKQQWKKYTAIIQGTSGQVRKHAADIEEDVANGSKRQRGSADAADATAAAELLPGMNDTVGCVVVDADGHIAAGVSSGGIALKTPGRVGEAALYGAGCWAHSACKQPRREVAVACSVTGVGERIMHGMVAKECAMHVAAAVAERNGHEDSQLCAAAVSSACSKVLQQTILAGPPPRECGVLCVAAHRHGRVLAGDRYRSVPGAGPFADGVCGVEVELAAVHCVSQSMAVAYLEQGSCGSRTEYAAVLRRGAASADHTQVLAFGTSWPANA